MKERQQATVEDDNRSNKDKLLDAAEELFATKGFDGTTTREITRKAGVPLGLMSYYFGTKSDLYTEVIDRRSDQHVADVTESVNAAKEAAGNRPLTVRELIQAYWGAIIEKCLRRGPGWKHYIQLLSRAASVATVSEIYIVPFARTYQVLPKLVITELREIFPDAREEDIYWSYYILSSTLIHMILENDRIDVLSDGLCKAGDLDTVTDKVATLFDFGLRGLLTSTPATKPSKSSKRRRTR